MGKVTKKIFIADDNQLFVDAVVTTLAADGYDYRAVNAKHDVVEQIKDYKPSIIILDIKMPFADGLEICRSIKKDPALRTAYVIILSGLGRDEDICAGEIAGANKYMVKPFAPTELLSVIKAVPVVQ